MIPSPAQFVAHLVAVGHRPAAVVGDWFGHGAVVAPDLVARRTPLADAFPAGPEPTDGATARDSARDSAQSSTPWHFGWLPYCPPEVEPAAFAASTRDVVVFDDGRWSIPDGSGVDPEWLTAVLSDAAHAAHAAHAHDPAIEWDGGDRAAHERGVLDCLAAIRAGDVYQACVSTRFHGTVTAPEPAPAPAAEPAAEPATPNPTVRAAAAWWARRVVKHEPVRAAFLAGTDADGRDVVVASLSPEEFLVRDGATVRESPIKGTVPLSADPAELAASRKDVAENIMIVDLVRHDLGQVAVTGGVRATDLLAVRPAPGVWHLVSEVTAELPGGLPHADLIDACFPPASVTGTPKIRAAELLSEWEPVERGVHCGAIGASTGEMLELNVAIRTAEFRGPGSVLHDANADTITVEVGVGGGITIDSDPDAEWAEILAKAAPLIDPA
ncbi:aminodeoxychorismate synthase component I [Corynebacterium freneyi]|uniref:Para-aminobenzoate synthetase component 1 n=1 Tax=Corynebacterium freneyi TaxID=134034 RepID=A0ABS4U6P0_9CORY|nr:aminodeoxychorismate synthase component I [Corynebacterium freneyi]MBP2331853.1 para-aminobenzoate synthetase component 1 [Corynebacterium freneyi]QXA53871.1 aminodeoxychorismate synthase component I [Corynebacterium freneyi]WJZ06026.1 Aminodeoxychorismate synthase component 1 [Corynebacterium freneyi]